jgi:hypothetical protein
MPMRWAHTPETYPTCTIPRLPLLIPPRPPTTLRLPFIVRALYLTRPVWLDDPNFVHVHLFITSITHLPHPGPPLPSSLHWR